MLGVLKRRWKPSKRTSNSREELDLPLNSDLVLEKPHSVPSPRQIHPVYEEKVGLLGYGSNNAGSSENFPPAPNIVVEGGRIEFVRSSQDGFSIFQKNTISRSTQTSIEHVVQSDPLKEKLKARIQELEQILHKERLGTQHDRAIITKLQRQANKKSATQRDAVERERRLRIEADARWRETTAEAERVCCRVRQLERELARSRESQSRSKRTAYKVDPRAASLCTREAYWEATCSQHSTTVSLVSSGFTKSSRATPIPALGNDVRKFQRDVTVLADLVVQYTRKKQGKPTRSQCRGRREKKQMQLNKSNI